MVRVLPTETDTPSDNGVRVHPDLRRWAGLSAAVVSDCNGRQGAMTAHVRRLSGNSFVGPAHTVEIVPGDNLTIYEELEVVEPGSVLVVDAKQDVSRAVWGEVMTHAAMTRDVLGVVIDGAVRDLQEARALGFAIFARGASPAGPHKAGGGRGRGLVSCGGVPVSQGDVVVGDADGVAVVRRADAEAVHARAVARLEQEKEWISSIRGGLVPRHVLGLAGPRTEGS